MIASPLRLLASVRDAVEARLAAALGADIVDCKEPDHGALGAVPQAALRQILAELGGGRPIVSATVGDLPLEPHLLAGAIRQTAAIGVDIVKFGLFVAGEQAQEGLRMLDTLLRTQPVPVPLVAVLLADRINDIDALCALAGQVLRVRGVSAVMLDTVTKGDGASRGRSLPEIFSVDALRRFVQAVRAAGASAGLAGSLRVEQITMLETTGADVLGFRGALCGGARTSALEPAAVTGVVAQIALANAVRKSRALASKTTVVRTWGSDLASSG